MGLALGLGFGFGLGLGLIIVFFACLGWRCGGDGSSGQIEGERRCMGCVDDKLWGEGGWEIFCTDGLGESSWMRREEDGVC